MSTYAAHLETFNDVADAVRECATLAADIAGSFPLRTNPHYRKAAERYARFERNLADAQHHGMRDEDTARRLLRDAVHAVYDLGMHAATSGTGMRQDLSHRANDVMKEFKPNYTRNYGLEVGDRVEFRVSGKGIMGEIVGVDGWDNNAAVMRTDDGEEMKVVCEWCERLPAYEGPDRSPEPVTP